MLVLKVVLSALAPVAWQGQGATALASPCSTCWSSRATEIGVSGTLCACVCFPWHNHFSPRHFTVMFFGSDSWLVLTMLESCP